MSRTVALVAMALVLTAARTSAQAQGTDSHAPNVLSTVTVTVTAEAPSNNFVHRAWHMDEDRSQVVAMQQENHRLATQLHGYDNRIVTLETRLVEVKAEHDRKVAGIAAIEDEAADTRRRRVEMEERLRKAETSSVADAGVLR